MTVVQLERAALDDGLPVMYRDTGGRRVRVAYDPRQTTEAGALAVVLAEVPRLACDMQLRRLPI